MSNEARSGVNERRQSSQSTHNPAIAVKETSSLNILEHYLYGKNVVRAIDMQNMQKQRTSDKAGIERNNNGQSSLSEGTVPKNNIVLFIFLFMFYFICSASVSSRHTAY